MLPAGVPDVYLAYILYDLEKTFNGVQKLRPHKSKVEHYDYCVQHYRPQVRVGFKMQTNDNPDPTKLTVNQCFPLVLVSDFTLFFRTTSWKPTGT